jgi:cyclopropane fatty-acyl-phospholipid synthase-like methyltransferase
LAQILGKEKPSLLGRVEYHGMDIDPELLAKAEDFTKDCPIPRHFHHGNALLLESFPPGPFTCFVSTGLNEFLDSTQIIEFFRNVHEVLAPGGRFFTSCTQQEQSSEFLMRAFELNTRYHKPDELKQILSQLPWSRVQIWQHETGMQTFVEAVK